MKREARVAFQRAERLKKRGEIPAAIAELERVVALEPDLQSVRLALGSVWLEAGEAEKAIVILSPLLKPRSAYRMAVAEKLKQAEQLKVLHRSPPGYIRHLFDQFSQHYDRQMVEDLTYCAPAILRRLADLVGCAKGPVDVLDLGCGTGLAGELFRSLARRLDGVDLSPRMIAHAKRKAIYDKLAVADVESFLAARGRDYDLILAADVLVYFGDLAAVFRGCKLRLRQGGWCLFTAEKYIQAISAEVEAGPAPKMRQWQNSRGFALGPKRRFRHSADYIRETAMKAGLECMGLLDSSPRMDEGQPVEGLAVALRKP